MTEGERFDIDGADDVYSSENWPFMAAAYRQPLRPAAFVAGGALFTVVVLCALLIISWATGWMADEISRVLP